MADTLSQQEREGDGTTTNIQLGIYVPSATVAVNKARKQKATSDRVLSETNHDETSKERRVTFESCDHKFNDDELHSVKRQKIENIEEDVSNEQDILAADGEDMAPTLRKKKRKRTRKGCKQNKGNGTKISCIGRDEALEYLRKWNTDITNWTFRKKAQHWLLQNMFDKSKIVRAPLIFTSQIPKADFKILLQYMVGLKGNQRQLVLTRARDYVSEQQSTDKHNDSDGPNLSRTKHKRSLAIMKILL